MDKRLEDKTLNNENAVRPLAMPQKKSDSLRFWLMTAVAHLVVIGAGLMWYYHHASSKNNPSANSSAIAKQPESVPIPATQAVKGDLPATDEDDLSVSIEDIIRIEQRLLSWQIMAKQSLLSTHTAKLNPAAITLAKMPTSGQAANTGDITTVSNAKSASAINTGYNASELVLTERDIPSHTSQAPMSKTQIAKNLAKDDNSKQLSQEATDLSASVDEDYEKLTELIDKVKQKNQQAIDKDHQKLASVP